jgi:glycosyltransferase involved in cell wall biosynthesis
MSQNPYQVLNDILDVYSSNPSLAELRKHLTHKTLSPSSTDDIDDIVSIYQAAIPIIATELWSAGMNESSIKLYQQLFQEMEALIALQDNDNRYKFVIIIPVADRPKHLQSCLQSLLTLCHSFRYGGYSKQQFPKVSVIIADDTRDPANILKHKELARHYNSQGIETIYFGLEEQQAQLARLSTNERRQLLNIVGNFDSSTFYHKGPSIMRNIIYLKLHEMCEGKTNLLFYFVDSDQEFQIKIQSSDEDKDVYALNYFYELDRIFSNHDINILTGKVIGDPPVSPAVMAGTFLDDIINFLHRLAATEHNHSCQFHDQNHRQEYDAAYHDMAELFGFQPAADAYPYRCCLGGEHDHAKCLADFSSKLNQFFHGEHPTRKSYFNHKEPVSDIKPARTIYTGNYVFNTEGLNYFIPFARLKLRMAGPVLGRIIKAEIKDRFVSANLPMLHKRTVEEIGKSEFRPGINSEHNTIDLSGEFERQFFGDVMLFTMEKLIAMGYPTKPVEQQMIVQTLEATGKDMRQRYASKQAQIRDKLNLLKSLFFDNNHWWQTISGMESVTANFTIFINNIEKNFGAAARCYELIDSKENRSIRFKQMLEAIRTYPADRQNWTNILERERDTQTVDL